MSRVISNSDDVIDSREVIARIEELESERDNIKYAPVDDDAITLKEWDESDSAEELKALLALQGEADGSADWRHGETLIRDSYFEDYARELAEDCGMIKDDASWPYTCIDWERAAHELQQDYTSVDYDGVTYWIRS